MENSPTRRKSHFRVSFERLTVLQDGTKSSGYEALHECFHRKSLFACKTSMKVKSLWGKFLTRAAGFASDTQKTSKKCGRNEVFRWKECVTDNVYVTNIPKAPESNDKRSINGSPFLVFVIVGARISLAVHLSKDVTSSCNGDNNELSVTTTGVESNEKFCLILGELDCWILIYSIIRGCKRNFASWHS